MQVTVMLARAAAVARDRSTLLVLGVVLLASACTSSEPQTFEKAAADATDRLVAQTGKLPAFLAKIESTLTKPDAKTPRRTVTIDPMIDTITGEQTETTMLFERRVVQRTVSLYPQFEFLPFQTANLGRAQYLLTGTIARVPTAPLGKPTVRLNLALTELRTGLVVAQAWSLAREENLDQTPSRYYRDVPVLIKDKIVEGYARTSTTTPGQHADSYYLERIGAASVISEATTLYNAEKYQDALGQYRSVLATPQGEQLRVQSGIYLTSMRLGNVAEAEQAFGRIVALGIAYNELGVKFLFSPGSTDFWSDPKISGAYGMWLHQIALEAVAAKSCVAVVGHTSRSGPGPVNDALSLKRAQYVRQRLIAEAPELAGRTRAEGMGFRQNIVGSGTDDSFDVLDRRVEFRIVPCA
ncbi:MAG TPA: OmpA family protein [Caldimonas sp.]|jgi:flagellar motor protein MotB|nr:OmpA family protein [Caldimonas sp.]HEX4232945.1 OmpA family protein [Caldimonas sp.]